MKYAVFLLLWLTFPAYSQDSSAVIFVNEDTTAYRSLSAISAQKDSVKKVKFHYGKSTETLDSVLTFLSPEILELVYCDFTTELGKLLINSNLIELKINGTPITDYRFLGKMSKLKRLSIINFDCDCILIFPEKLNLDFLRIAGGKFKLPQDSSVKRLFILYGNFRAFPKQIFRYKNLERLQIINNFELKFPANKQLKLSLPKLNYLELDFG